MKLLSKNQVEYIKQNIKEHGVTSVELLDELTDHICSIIEKEGFKDIEDFYLVHRDIIEEFKTENFLLIQDLTNRISNHKNHNEMKTIKIIMACLTGYATFVMVVSLFLESINSGPGDALRMTGFVVYGCVILLLSYFLIRFKKGMASLKITEGLLGYFLAFTLISVGLREINFEAGSSLLQTVPYFLFGFSLIAITLFIRQRIKSQIRVKT